MSLGSFADKGGFNVPQDFIDAWKKKRRNPSGLGKDFKASDIYTALKAKGVNLNPSGLGVNFNPADITKGLEAATAAKSAVSSATSTAGQRAPLADDAQAAAARAQAVFDATRQRNALTAAAAYDATDLEEAIRRLNTARPDDENAAKNAANAANLSSSSTIVNQLGKIAQNYVRQESDLRTAFDRKDAERRAQQADIDAQSLLTQASIDAALADRQAQTDTQAAGANALAPPANAAPDPATATVGDYANWLATHRLVGTKWKPKKKGK